MSSKKAAQEKQFYVASVAPEELSDYMFVISMVLGATAMFVKVSASVPVSNNYNYNNYCYYYSIAY